MFDDFLTILGAIALSIVLVYVAVWMMFLVFDSPDLDAQCKARYGQDYSYYSGRGADCVNSQGEGKFLKQ